MTRESLMVCAHHDDLRDAIGRLEQRITIAIVIMASVAGERFMEIVKGFLL